MNRCKTKSNSRTGTVLICVLACLGIVIAMVMTTVQSSLRGRAAVRMQRQMLQTELLCEAGVKRAVQQFSKSVEYRGEMWMPKSFTSPFEHAVIEIKLQPSSDTSKSINAEVVASLASSANSSDRMQRSHAFTLSLEAFTPENK